MRTTRRRLAPLAAVLGAIAAGCATSPPPPRPPPRAQAPAPAPRGGRTEPTSAARPAPARAAAGGEARRGAPPPATAADPAAPPPAADAAVAAPAPVSAPPPPPPPPPPGEQALRHGETAERAGDLDGAFGAYRRAAQLGEPGAAARADAVRRRMVARHAGAARGALARQDLDGSIRQWERVLELDPGNETARLERQRAITLREKVRALK